MGVTQRYFLVFEAEIAFMERPVRPLRNFLVTAVYFWVER